LPPGERTRRLSFPAGHPGGRLPLGALPPNRGARSDLPGGGVRRRHHSLKRRLRVLGGTTASLTVSVDGPGDQREHATRVHARGYTASRDHPSEDHARGRGGVLFPKRLTERLANGSVNGLTVRSAERLSGCLCECYRQCFFRIPFTLAFAIRLRTCSWCGPGCRT
jgi:hypothetical protein